MSDYTKVNVVNGVTAANATTMDVFDEGILTNSTRTSYSNTVGGTANAITITTSGGNFSFAVGESVKGIATANNTGAVTVNIDGDGVTTVKKLDGSSYIACEADDFEDNKPFELIGQNDGTDFFLLAPKGGAESIVSFNTFSVNPAGAAVASTLRLDVTGSGWITAILNVTASSKAYSLEVDGTFIIGSSTNLNSIKGESSIACMFRYETGFKLYSNTDEIGMSYLDGDNYRKATPNIYNPNTSGTLQTLLLDITGKGTLFSMYTTADDTRIEIDGTVINSDKDLRTTNLLLPYNTSLKVYSGGTDNYIFYSEE